MILKRYDTLRFDMMDHYARGARQTDGSRPSTTRAGAPMSTPMSTPSSMAMTAPPIFDPFPVNVRIKISALWASTMFVIAFVDIFGLFRADYRADIEAGEVSGFTIGQSFLLATTVYVAIPSLMVFLTLVLRPKVSRIANITLSIVYALTIVGAAIGEWNYYLLASAIELVLLGTIVWYARTWPRVASPTAISDRMAPHGV